MYCTGGTEMFQSYKSVCGVCFCFIAPKHVLFPAEARFVSCSCLSSLRAPELRWGVKGWGAGLLGLILYLPLFLYRRTSFNCKNPNCEFF